MATEKSQLTPLRLLAARRTGPPTSDPKVARKLIASGLLTGSATYLLSNLLSAAIPFGLLPILTRYMTPAQYGQVGIYQALLAALVAFIGLTGHGAAAVKYYDSATSPGELKCYIGNCLLVLTATMLLTLIVAVGFARQLSAWLGLDLRWLLLAVAAAGASFVVSMRMTQWQIRKLARRYGLFQVSQSLTNVSLSLLLVVPLLMGAPGRMLGMSLAPACFALVALVLLYRDRLLAYAWRPQYVREIVAYGVPLIPHSVGYFFLSSVDRLVINARLGSSEVGIYLAAAQVASGLALVFDAINSAYVPWLFERLKRDEIAEKRQIVRWTYRYFLLLAVVAALAFQIGPLVLVVVAGAKYAAGAAIIGWLILGWVFHGMYLMVTNYVFFAKRTGLLSLSTITAGLCNVGLLLWLVPREGLRGAAFAFAISSAVKWGLTWMVAQQSYPMPWLSFRSATR